MLEEYNANPFTMTRTYVAPNPQKKSIQKEINETLEQLPVLKEVVKHLDEQIAFLNSLDSIDVDLSKDPELFQKEHASNMLARTKLQAERSYILARVERTIKR